MFPHHSDQTSQRFLFYQTLFFIDRFYQKYGKILVTVRPMFQGGEWGGDTLPIFGKVAHTDTDSHTLYRDRLDSRISKLIVNSRFEMLKSKLLLNLDLIRTLFSLV